MRIQVSVEIHMNKLFGCHSDLPVTTGFQKDGESWAFYLRLHPGEGDVAAPGDFSRGLLGESGIRLLDKCRLTDIGTFYSQKSSVSCLPMTLDAQLRAQISDLLTDNMVSKDMAQGSCIYMWLLANLSEISALDSLITIGYNGNESLTLLAGLMKSADGEWRKSFYAVLPDIEFFGFMNLSTVKMMYCELADNSTEFKLFVHASLHLLGQMELTGTFEFLPDSINAMLCMENPLNFGFVVIERQPSDKGIIVSYECRKTDTQNKNNLIFKGRLSFFGLAIDCEADYSSLADNQWELSMPIEFKGCTETSGIHDSLVNLFGDKICLVYNSKSGFRIEDVGNCKLGDSLDFVKQFNDLLEVTRKGNCKAISLSKKNKIQVKTDIKPGIEGIAGSKNGYRIFFTGSIFLTGNGNKINIELRLPQNIGISLSSEWNISDFLNEVISCVTNTLLDLFKEFLSGGKNDNEDNSKNAEQLKNLLIYLFEEEAKSVLSQLVCRKLVESAFAEIVMAMITEAAAEDPFIPPFVPLPSGGGGGEKEDPDSKKDPDFGDKNPPEKEPQVESLQIPKFDVHMTDESVRIQVTAVSGADAYEICIRSVYGQEQSTWYDKYKAEGAEITDIMLPILEVPVYGSISVLVCAISESELKAGEWSSPVSMTEEITYERLIRLAYAKDYCIRDCYAMLTEHHVTVSDRMVLKAVLDVYGKPDFSGYS